MSLGIMVGWGGGQCLLQFVGRSRALARQIAAQPAAAVRAAKRGRR